MSNLTALALEGVPGTGKSSVASVLAARYDAQHTSLPDRFRRFRVESRIDRSGASLTRLVYYLAATSHMVDLVDPTRPVIFDRWLPSVLGLIETSGDLDRDDIAAIAEPIASRLPAPRATIVLTAAPDVLQRRVTGRRKPPLHHTEAHHMAFADPQWLSSWQHAILFWSARLGPHHVIDTSTMALDEVTVTIQEMWTPDGESHR